MYNNERNIPDGEESSVTYMGVHKLRNSEEAAMASSQKG